MRNRMLSLLLVLCFTLMLAPQTLASDEEALSPILMDFSMDCTHAVTSVGRYSNWAGLSSVSQFEDEKGNFCFAVDEGRQVSIFKTEYGKLTHRLSIENPYDSFGAAICDGDGNLYLVWGRNNGTEDSSVATIFVNKYTADGALIASVGGNGSEGMEYYYDANFNTKEPFAHGNCDVAISGELLAVNYARRMYSAHQSNTLFVVNIKTMTVEKGITTYNSHSFDQRVTAYKKTGGFLLASQGDCYPRAFSTAVTDKTRTLNERETFHFWVERGTFDNYDMSRLNITRSRLGNILETQKGAALVAASARSLSENAKTEPYDVFVQVFDPTLSASGAESYFTSGVRSGIAGRNGDTQVTDYGVQWLTDLAGSGKSVDVVQAVLAGEDTIAVLYELYRDGLYDSTWYMLLRGDGSVLKSASALDGVRLNKDEDPVYTRGAVQWVSNQGKSNQIVLHSLYLGLPDAEQSSELSRWRMSCLTDVAADAYYAQAVFWAMEKGVTTGTSMSTFSPDSACTRAQAVTFLWRAMGKPEPESTASPFSDVQNQAAYYYKAVLWANENHITTGTGDNQFSPDHTCTRAQIVTFLWRDMG